MRGVACTGVVVRRTGRVTATAERTDGEDGARVAACRHRRCRSRSAALARHRGRVFAHGRVALPLDHSAHPGRCVMTVITDGAPYLATALGVTGVAVVAS